MGIPSATGSESPDAEFLDKSRFGDSVAGSGADLGAMRSTANKLLPLPVRAIPRTALAVLADSVSELAVALERRLRGRAVSALGKFGATLDGEARRVQQNFPAIGKNSDFVFAVRTLGPRRIRAAQQTLDASDEHDYVSLIGFLQVTVEGLRYDIDHAADEDDAADAFLGALDGLHDYLLARELVGSAYRLAQSDGDPIVFKVGSLAHTRARAWASLSSSAPDVSAATWQRAARRAQLSSRRFSRDEPKQQVNVA